MPLPAPETDANQSVETDANPSPTVDVNRLVNYGLLAALTAVAANGALFVLAVDVFAVPVGFPLSWGPILASTAIPALLATAVYGVLASRFRRPNRAFVVVAAAVLAVSFVPFASPPPELAGAPRSVRLTLGTMHVLAAVAIVGPLSRVPTHTASSDRGSTETDPSGVGPSGGSR